jgi:hypothetical protein
MLFLPFYCLQPQGSYYPVCLVPNVRGADYRFVSVIEVDLSKRFKLGAMWLYISQPTDNREEDHRYGQG